MLPWVEAVQSVRKDWHYNIQLNVFQKTKGTTYVYVCRLLTGYCVQLYLRGSITKSNYCLVELRSDNYSKESLQKMYEYGEKWLDCYHDGKEEDILSDEYSTYNPNGVWGIERLSEKGYII